MPRLRTTERNFELRDIRDVYPYFAPDSPEKTFQFQVEDRIKSSQKINPNCYYSKSHEEQELGLDQAEIIRSTFYKGLNNTR